MSDNIDFDRKDQMERIRGGLIPGETLHAVYDMKGGGTGFIGLTDRRLIFQDEGVFKKKRSLISVPYNHVSILASSDLGGAFRATSELSITTSGGQTFDFEFRSGDKAQRAYVIILQHLN